LQKGDGDFLQFGDDSIFPRVVIVAMGNGVKRPVKCSTDDCEGLLNVVSMTTGPDGSIYVGDYNLVRKVTLQGDVATILEFGNGQGSYHYDLKISPADGLLYIAHSERRQILRVDDLDRIPRNVEDNFSPVVGDGMRCVPGDRDKCGDGGPATEARLAYPKGLAVAVDHTMYITDGRNVRVVTPDGKINTLVGHHGSQAGPPRPLPCKNIFSAADVQLQWPTKLALNPLDSTLYIVDDTMILRLTSDLRLQVVAGRSPMCNGGDKSQSFGPIADLSFSPEGKLFVAEKRPAPENSIIRTIDQNGAIENFAGKPQSLSCSCAGFFNCTEDSSCSIGGNVPSNQIVFGSLSSLTVAPDSTIHVADNSQHRILSLKQALPTRASPSSNVKVADPASKSIYTFNRYGQHVSTHSLETSALLYKFAYSKNTVFGRLTVVLDGLGNKLTLQRDYTNRVQSVENTLGQKHSVTLSRFGNLLSFGDRVKMEYLDDLSGLLLSKSYSDEGDFFVYGYDRHGRLDSATFPSGESLQLESSVVDCDDDDETDPALCVKVLGDGGRSVVHDMAVHQSGMVRLGKRCKSHLICQV
jgi:hypothetical protein